MNNRKKINRKYNISKTYETKYNSMFNFLMLPILYVISIIPLTMRVKQYNPKMEQYNWFPKANSNVDIFLYFKQWSLVAVALLMILVMVYHLNKHKEKVKNISFFIPLGVYAFTAILSTIFSVNMYHSLHGSMDQFESIFAVLAYCIIVYYASFSVRKERDIKIFVWVLVGSVLILSVLALSQFLGHDFFATDKGLKLIAPREYWNNSGSVKFRFGEGTVYLTFFNPNYVGVYVSMIIPIFGVLFLFSRKVLTSILYIIAIIGLAIALKGSGSFGGSLGLLVALVFSLVFFWRTYLKRAYLIPIIVFLSVISLYVLNNRLDDAITKFKSTVTDEILLAKEEPKLSHIDTKEDEIIIRYKNNTMSLSMDFLDSGIYVDVKDETGNVIPYNYNEENNQFIIDDDRFPGFVFAPESYNGHLGFYIRIDGKTWRFTNQTEDGTYYYHNSFGKLDKMETAPSALFTGYEKFASKRGYLWSRTIPLLKENIFIGSGPDTFAIAFSQTDYLYKERYFPGMIITKPHSLYLQIGVQTGVLSLIAFLVFYGMYFVQSVRIYIKGSFKNYYAQVGFAIFIGTIAYMISGLANDSSITTAPVFWTLIGIGIVANQKAKPLVLEEVAAIKELKNEKKARKHADKEKVADMEA